MASAIPVSYLPVATSKYLPNLRIFLHPISHGQGFHHPSSSSFFFNPSTAGNSCLKCQGPCPHASYES